MYPMKQSTLITVPFFCHDENGDAVTGLTDGSFTKRISKGSASFGAMTVTISEMENGWYSIPLSTSHSDTLGLLSVTFTNAGCKQVNLQYRIEANLLDDITTGVVLSTTVLNQIADHVIRRQWANVEASSDGDALVFRSTYGAVAKLVNKVAIVGTDLIIYKDDDSTALGTQALTTDAAADPITALDTV